MFFPTVGGIGTSRAYVEISPKGSECFCRARYNFLASLKFIAMTRGLFIASLLLTFGTMMAQPQKFAEGIISNDEVFGFCLVEDVVLTVHSRGGRDTLTIVESRRLGKGWSKPVPVSFSNKPGVWKDIDPVISPDGKWLIFNSNRPVHPDSSAKDFDVWKVSFSHGMFGQPERFGHAINSPYSDYYASVSSSGNMYFTSTRPGGFGESDLYVSTFINGAHMPAANLGVNFNTARHESNPFIAPDEDYLIFVADPPDTYGDSDLYIAFRNGSQWTKPVNMGAGVNSPVAEFAPFVKNSTLYFTRMVRGKPMVENIYSMELDLGKLRKKALSESREE
jgi:hypothetical protein